MTNRSSQLPSGKLTNRRELLRRASGVTLGAAALPMTMSIARASGTTRDRSSGMYQDAPAPVGSGEAGEVLVRTAGGAYEDAWRTAAWEPFAEETGIKVIPVATNAAKIMAMIEAGDAEVDILDFGTQQMGILGPMGALQPFDASRFELTNPEDLIGVRDTYVECIVFSQVMGYNTEAFPDGHPTSWAEFWDTETFPGPRTLVDAAEGTVNLEFALLADGVPMDELYPLDVDRAFKKLAEIRDSVVKWWDSAAIASQMFAEKQAVLGCNYNGRLQGLIDGGEPLAIEWNQSERLTQTFSIMEGAKNVDNAYRLIDFCMQPEVQARFAETIPYGPANKAAFDLIDEETASKLPTSPEHMEMSFAQDGQWWAENTSMVAERWQEFLLEG